MTALGASFEQFAIEAVEQLFQNYNNVIVILGLFMEDNPDNLENLKKINNL